MMRFLCTMAFCLAAVLLVACGNREQVPQKDNANAALSVVVSIVPQVYFVERIAGDLATVDLLAPPNHTAETHQVTPRQMDILSRADVYFRIGMPFETALVRRLESTCPNLKIVDTREGVTLLGGVCTHDHDDHHHHEGDDPHIWLDPQRVKIQARTIAKELSTLAPSHAPAFTANLEIFEKDLDALRQRLAEILAPMKDKVIYVYHPAFGYLADAYGFEQRSIETEGKDPGSKRLYELIDEIKNAGVKVIFDQPQFAEGSVQVIAKEANVKVVALDGLMQDYITGMEALAKAIAGSLE
jgi:zinc transport system substrate-binding protein